MSCRIENGTDKQTGGHDEGRWRRRIRWELLLLERDWWHGYWGEYIAQRTPGTRRGEWPNETLSAKNARRSHQNHLQQTQRRWLLFRTRTRTRTTTRRYLFPGIDRHCTWFRCWYGIFAITVTLSTTIESCTFESHAQKKKNWQRCVGIQQTWHTMFRTSQSESLVPIEGTANLCERTLSEQNYKADIETMTTIIIIIIIITTTTTIKSPESSRAAKPPQPNRARKKILGGGKHSDQNMYKRTGRGKPRCGRMAIRRELESDHPVVEVRATVLVIVRWHQLSSVAHATCRMVFSVFWPFRRFLQFSTSLNAVVMRRRCCSSPRAVAEDLLDSI